jgi:curved DNA-binding protein
MRDHYQTLGLSSAATNAEIRRAYRILARRYHPDVNPGRHTAEQFRAIAEAYDVLSDSAKRKQYDQERELHDTFSSAFDRAHQAYRKQQQHGNQAKARKEASRPPPQPEPTPRPEPQPQPKPIPQPQLSSIKLFTRSWLPSISKERVTTQAKEFATKVRKTAKTISSWVEPFAPKAEEPKTNRVTSIALVEVSISIIEAIQGVRKTVEFPEENGEPRKISVLIPPGARQGSIIRLRSKDDKGEEIIALVRVADHKWLSISHRGLMMEIPITIAESVSGAKVQVPSLGDPLLVTVEPGTQSGKEVRLKGQGVFLADGTRGDLYIRFLIQAPSDKDAPGLTEAANALSQFYQNDVRASLPRKIGEEVQP